MAFGWVSPKKRARKKPGVSNDDADNREYGAHILVQLAVVVLTLGVLFLVHRLLLHNVAVAIPSLYEMATARSTAILLNGVHAGALLFVGGAVTRTLTALVRQRNKYVLQVLLPILGPHGSDFTLPLMALVIAAHAARYYASGNAASLVCAAMVAAIEPYTQLVMGKNIQRLLSGNDADVLATTQDFCRKHHVRSVLSLAAVVIAIVV